LLGAGEATGFAVRYVTTMRLIRMAPQRKELTRLEEFHMPPPTVSGSDGLIRSESAEYFAEFDTTAHCRRRIRDADPATNVVHEHEQGWGSSVRNRLFALDQAQAGDRLMRRGLTEFGGLSESRAE
jgi:hypothetical protein